MGDTLKLHFRTSTEALDDNIGSLKNNKLEAISNIVCGTQPENVNFHIVRILISA
jgi:hypothetical protein